MKFISLSQRSSGVEQLSCKQPVVGSNPAVGSQDNSSRIFFDILIPRGDTKAANWGRL